ncbi:hypothetical protein C8R44DRAFT_881820 [Mycena epipterygia]|nr:hypothetical protein C8R44DRAFT_881820 [Mycena epipterygia]
MPPTRTVDARGPPEDPFDPLAATGQNVADIVMTDIDIELWYTWAINAIHNRGLLSQPFRLGTTAN